MCFDNVSLGPQRKGIPHKDGATRQAVVRRVGNRYPTVSQDLGQVSNILIRYLPRDDWLSKGMSAAHAATLIAIPFAHVLVAAGISVLALKFLYGKYKEMYVFIFSGLEYHAWPLPSLYSALSARYLGAYIVHLICILQRLLDKTQDINPPRALSKKLVLEVLEEYDERLSVEVCMRIGEMTVDHQFENGIADLIRQHTIPLGFDERGLGAEKAKHRPCIVM